MTLLNWFSHMFLNFLVCVCVCVCVFACVSVHVGMHTCSQSYLTLCDCMD